MKFSSIFSYILLGALIITPVAVFAGTTQSQTISELQAQLASLQQIITNLLAVSPKDPDKKLQEPPGQAKKIIPEQSATPTQTSTSGQSETVKPTATQPSGQSEKAQSTTATQPTTPVQPTEAQIKQTVPMSPEAQTAKKAILEQIQTKIQSLQMTLKDLQHSAEVPKAISASELKLARTLERGSSGDDVKQLQGFLKQFPDLYPEGLVTGTFGPATEKAVKRFQEKNGLESVGSIGPKTREKLKDLTAGSCAQSTARPCYDRQTGKKVKQLQSKGGEQAFAACLKNSAHSDQGTLSVKTSSGDEAVQYCYEGKSNVFLRKFAGTSGGTTANLSCPDYQPVPYHQVYSVFKYQPGVTPPANLQSLLDNVSTGSTLRDVVPGTTHALLQLKNGDVLASQTEFDTSTGGYTNITSSIYKSSDKGLSWTGNYLLPPNSPEVGNFAGVISHLAEDSNGIVYGAGFGVWKSTDGGNTWKLLTVPIKEDENGKHPFVGDYASNRAGISQILVLKDNSIIITVPFTSTPFRSGDYTNVYKSIDGGATWTVLLTYTSSIGYVRSVVELNDGGLIFGDTGIAALYEFINGSLISPVLPQSSVFFGPSNLGPILKTKDGTVYLTIHEDVKTASGKYLRDASVIYASSDNAKTWSKMGEIPRFPDLFMEGSDGSLYAGISYTECWGGIVYKSIDKGKTWTLLSGTVPQLSNPGVAFYGLNALLEVGGKIINGGGNLGVLFSSPQIGTTPASVPTSHSKAVSITTASLPTATLQMRYRAELGVGGGTAPYTWSISSGVLPIGVTLDAKTGVISGLLQYVVHTEGLKTLPLGPAELFGKTTIAFEVVDAVGSRATKNLDLVINRVVEPELGFTLLEFDKGRDKNGYGETISQMYLSNSRFLPWTDQGYSFRNDYLKTAYDLKYGSGAQPDHLSIELSNLRFSEVLDKTLDVQITTDTGPKIVYFPAVPAVTACDTQWWGFYIAKDGSTYYTRSDHSCGYADLSPEEALVPQHLARGASATPDLSARPSSPTDFSPNSMRSSIISGAEILKITPASGGTIVYAPALKRLTPGKGPVGTIVTLVGTGFTPVGNTINWGVASGAAISNLSSLEGKTLSFTVPKNGCNAGDKCSISVTNANGTSNTVSFLLTQAVVKAGGNPSVKLITPNGGERFVQGRDKITISWTGGIEKVWLVLSPGNEGVIGTQYLFYGTSAYGGVITESGSPSGSYEWDGKNVCGQWIDYSTGSPVGITHCDPVDPGFYRITAVSQTKKGEPLTYGNLDVSDNRDDSDHDFLYVTGDTITSLNVVSPNGEERFLPARNSDQVPGSNVGFVWKQNNFVENALDPNYRDQVCTINLLKGGVYYGTLWKGYGCMHDEFRSEIPEVPAGSDYSTEIIFNGPNGDVRDVSDGVFTIGIVPGVVGFHLRFTDRFTESLSTLPNGAFYYSPASVYEGTRKDGSAIYPISASGDDNVHFGMSSDDKDINTQKALYMKERENHISNLPITIAKKADGSIEALIDILDMNPEPKHVPFYGSYAATGPIPVWTSTGPLNIISDVPVSKYLVEYPADGITKEYSVYKDINAYGDHYQHYIGLAGSLPLNYGTDINVSVVGTDGTIYKAPPLSPGTLGLEYALLIEELRNINGKITWKIGPNIRVISPNDATSLHVGDTKTIEWKPVNWPANTPLPIVDIYLTGSSYGTESSRLAFEKQTLLTTTSSTTYNWTIPSSLADGGIHRIFVGALGQVSSGYSDGRYNAIDFSDKPFWVTAP